MTDFEKRRQGPSERRETSPHESTNNPGVGLTLWMVFLVMASLMTACEPGGEKTPQPALSPAPGEPADQKGLAAYSPKQHELYDGRFRIRGTRIYQAGSLDDESPWDHMGNDASNLTPVAGEILLDVNEIENSGSFEARLELPQGDYVVTLDRVHQFSDCQDGGIAAFLYEHGDSGCGDSNWPKSLLYVAGWGYGSATLNGETLYEDYEIHFMVTQGMRNRETLEVQLSPAQGPAGAVNPAAQQLDFYIRSPAKNENNHPGREVFDHFFAMEVTWF